MLLTHSILLDCGEGTLNQLLRVSSEEVLTRIRVVLISHSHADHHLGLPLLLTQVARRVTEESEYTEKRPKRIDPSPLLIIGPPRVRLFLEMWSAFIPSISSVYTYLDIPVTAGIHGHDHVALPPIAPPVIRSEGITTETKRDGSFIVTIPDQNLTFKFYPVGIDSIAES